MIADRIQADNIYTKLERVTQNGLRIDYSRDADSILSRLDMLRDRMQGGR
jgi:hypothetical protein